MSQSIINSTVNNSINNNQTGVNMQSTKKAALSQLRDFQPSWKSLPNFKQRRTVPFYINDVESNDPTYLPNFILKSGVKVEEIRYYSYAINDEWHRLNAISHVREGFPYLKTDGLRVIKVKVNGKYLSLDEFITLFRIKISSSKKMFKIGKRLSSFLSKSRIGKYFKTLDIYVNTNPEYKKKMDGMIAISVAFAQSLDASLRAGDLINLKVSGGENKYVKSDAYVSEDIDHDIVVYSTNFKDEIKLDSERIYVSAERLKLGAVRADIQSVLNMFEGFTVDTWINIAAEGIKSDAEKVLKGELIEDRFYDMEEESMDKFSWVLQEAVNCGLDYRQYKPLYRMALHNVKKSWTRNISRDGRKSSFNFPILGAVRGYLTPDLLQLDKEGNVIPTLQKGEIFISAGGAIMFSLEDIEEVMHTLGGADCDDGLNLKPVVVNGENRILVWRNPNDQGEWVVKSLSDLSDIQLEYRDVLHTDSLPGLLRPESNVTPKPKKLNKWEEFLTKNNLMIDIPKVEAVEKSIEYNYDNIIQALHDYKGNSIGIVSNAGFVRSGIRISPKDKFKQFQEFKWNLEDIIDNHDDATKILNNLWQELIHSGAPVAKCLIDRIPEKLKVDDEWLDIRSKIPTAKNHPVDKLDEFIKKYEKYTEDIINEQISLIQTNLKVDCNPLVNEIAGEMYSFWRTKLNEAKEVEKETGTPFLDLYIDVVKNFLDGFNKMPYTMRKETVKCWMNFIYDDGAAKEYANKDKEVKRPSDTILWLTGDNGTAKITLEVLQEIGVAKSIEIADPVINNFLDTVFGIDDQFEDNGKGLRRTVIK